MANGNPLDKIEHVVVLMLENRSFDNLLGWLYDPANDAPFNVVPPDFEGLYGKNLSNPAPEGRLVSASPTPANLAKTPTARSTTSPGPSSKIAPATLPGPRLCKASSATMLLKKMRPPTRRQSCSRSPQRLCPFSHPSHITTRSATIGSRRSLRKHFAIAPSSTPAHYRATSKTAGAGPFLYK